MIHWLLDDPAGITILTVIASTVVAAATWAAFTVALVLLVTAVGAARRVREPRRAGRSTDAS